MGKKKVLNVKVAESKTKEIIKDGEIESKKIVGDSKKLGDLSDQFEIIKKSNFTKEICNYIELMTSIVKSYYRKEYRKVPVGTIVSIVSALAYVINPFDLIPDVIPGIGQLDDALVVAFCFKMVQLDLDKYALWLEENPKLDPRKNSKKETKKKLTKTSTAKKSSVKKANAKKDTAKKTASKKQTEKKK